MARKVEEIDLQDPNLGQQAMAVAEIDRTKRAVDPSGVIRSGRLKGLSMWAAIFVVSWPVLVESFLNAMVGMVDTALSAQISESATSAIAIASYFQWFIGLIAISLGVGATAMVSRAMGRGREAVARATTGQCYLLSGILGSAAGAFIFIFAPFIGRLTGLEPSGEAFGHAVNYLRYMAFGVPAVTLMFSAISCCRGAGDSLRPMLIMLIVNIVNIVVSIFLAGVDFTRRTLLESGESGVRVVFANPSPFDMGVDGIAIGTLAAWYVGAIGMTIVLVRGTHGLQLRSRWLRPHWHTIRRLIRVGFPNFLETAGMWFGNFLTVLMVGWMGNELLHGAHIVAIRVEAFSFLPGFAMATAAATLAGQYLGARSPALARLAVIRCALIASCIMGLFGLAFVGAPRFVVSLFSSQALHLQLTPHLMVLCGIVQIPFAIAIVTRGALRGAGDTKMVMLLTWTSTWGIRLPLAWLFSGVEVPVHDVVALFGVTPEWVYSLPNPAPLQEHFGIHPLVGLWIGLSMELALRFLLFTARFVQGGWQRVKV
ncbi:MAG: MATE family efflux transporter [Phycisphaeraceae bacterium]|nr:MAG: MATE family efflux transporter [Phycisphaeraceae bacterium]